MQTANARLREVGTTNRTHLADFTNAICADTAALMLVHPSNYQIQGFTHQPSRTELAELAHKHGLPLIDDLGSGTLVNLEQYGLGHEPTVREALLGGADLVTFSTDKLLGGPQGGVIVGRTDLIAQIKRSPMKRAMRCDKLTLSALAATLELYRHPDSLTEQLPVLASLTRTVELIDEQANRICQAMQEQLIDHADMEVIRCDSQIGSGALPGNLLPSFAIAIRPSQNSGAALEHWSNAMRTLTRPVLGRISNQRLLLDMRTMDDESGFVAQLPALVAALEKAN
jgi:L-seryl-tRNA(Ser) seleniumtransferase